MTRTYFAYVRLFLATFASALACIVGLGMLVLMFAPALADVIIPNPNQRTALPATLIHPTPLALVTPTPLPAVQPYPPVVKAEDVSAGDWILIPAIGVKVPLVLSKSINDDDVIASLKSGAALYPNGILPGRLGNTFIAAHSTGNPWHGPYKFAFLKINDLESGNVIHLDYKGTRYTYRITKKDLVKPSADYRVISDRPVPTVTLMACWPLWTTNQRMLVIGELTNVTKLTAKPS